jgi:methionyl aminopeptidase
VIHLKTPSEIEAMAKSGALLASVLAALKAAARPGVRTRDLDTLAARLIRRGGATPGFLGYRGFPASLCVSINDEIIHGIPGFRRLKEGDLVSLDLGLILNGWWADAGLSLVMEPTKPLASRLVATTQEALAKGIQAALVGGHLEDISFAIQAHVEAAGFGIVSAYSGHGLGRQMHEEPPVFNTGGSGNGPLLVPGMVLAIEPMVTAGSPSVYVKPDGWTVATSDHSLGAYFEHSVAITKDGPRILTAPL